MGRIYTVNVGTEKNINHLACYENSGGYMPVFNRGGLCSIPEQSIEMKSSSKKKL
jgi:hypothetical protein